MPDTTIKVLLVEDNDVDAEHMTDMLGRQAVEENIKVIVTRAKTLAEAFVLVNHNHAIIADLLLPDSPDILHTARNLCQQLDGPPVLAWSRSHDKTSIRACGRIGVRNFFWKDTEVPCLVANLLCAMGQAEAYAARLFEANQRLASKLKESMLSTCGT